MPVRAGGGLSRVRAGPGPGGGARPVLRPGRVRKRRRGRAGGAGRCRRTRPAESQGAAGLGAARLSGHDDGGAALAGGDGEGRVAGTRIRTSGPYSATRASGSTPYSSAACDASCSRRSRCSVLAISVPWAVFTTPSSSAETAVTWARTALRVSLRWPRSPPRRRPGARWPRPARLGGGHGRGRPGGDGAGDRALRGALPAADGGPLPGGPLGRGRRGQRVGPPADRAQPLLDGAHLEARLHLGLAGGGGPLGQLRAFVVGLLVLELRVAAPGPRRPPPRPARSSAAASLARSFSALRCGGADRGVEPLGLVGGRPRGPGQPAEPPGDLGRGRVGGAQPAADLLQHLPGLVGAPRSPRPGSPPPPRSASSAAASFAAASSAAARTSSSDCAPADPPCAQCAPIRSPSAVTQRKSGLSRTNPADSARSATTTTSASSSPTAPAARPAPSPGRPPTARLREGWGASDCREAGAARRARAAAMTRPTVPALAVRMAVRTSTAGVEAVHGEGLGGGAEGGGDGLLVAVGDGELGGERAEHAAEAVGVGEHRGGGVHARGAGSP